MRSATDRGGKAARVIAGGDRPGVARGVQFGDDADVLRRQPEGLCHDLRQHRAVALALRRGCHMNADRAERIERDGRRCVRAVFRARALALLRRQHSGDVAHVGDARFDHRRAADAVDTALGAGALAPREQILVAAVAECLLQRSGIVAGIVEAAGRRAIREGLRRHQIAPDDVDRVELELDGDALHQPLQREIHLRPAEAAVKARRRLVGEHDAVAHRDVANVIGAGQIAVHAIKRRRLRRTDVGADVLDLVPGERAHAAVGIDRRVEPGDAVGRGNRRRQMLDAVLDPFHRPAGSARGDAHQYDVGKHRLLDAEAAAGSRRRAQAQPIARHFQRPRHHRMQAERPLEIGQNIVGVLARFVWRRRRRRSRSACTSCADN